MLRGRRGYHTLRAPGANRQTRMRTMKSHGEVEAALCDGTTAMGLSVETLTLPPSADP